MWSSPPPVQTHSRLREVGRAKAGRLAPALSFWLLSDAQPYCNSYPQVDGEQYGQDWQFCFVLLICSTSYCSITPPAGEGGSPLLVGERAALLVGFFSVRANCTDPNADPDHAGSGWRHWSGDVWKVATPGTSSTKRLRKRPMNFQPNLRDQEAAGSSPATPAKLKATFCP